MSEVRRIIDTRIMQRELTTLLNKSVFVGVPDNNITYDNGTSLVEVATTHEYGSVSKNIPQRSFLKVPFLQKRSKIARTIRKFHLDVTLGRKTANTALNQLGIVTSQISKNSFTGNSWRPNTPITVLKKGSSRPLFDTGKLLQSITYEIR